MLTCWFLVAFFGSAREPVRQDATRACRKQCSSTQANCRTQKSDATWRAANVLGAGKPKDSSTKRSSDGTWQHNIGASHRKCGVMPALVQVTADSKQEQQQGVQEHGFTEIPRLLVNSRVRMPFMVVNVVSLIPGSGLTALGGLGVSGVFPLPLETLPEDSIIWRVGFSAWVKVQGLRSPSRVLRLRLYALGLGLRVRGLVEGFPIRGPAPITSPPCLPWFPQWKFLLRWASV